MKAAVMLSLSVALVACKSDEARRYEKIAARANPLVEKLRPAASSVLQQTDPTAVRTACLHAIEVAAPLGLEKFNDRKALEERVGVDDVLQAFAMRQSDLYCREGLDDGSRCVHWCKEMFQDLVAAFDHLHQAAAKEHVEIKTLTP